MVRAGTGLTVEPPGMTGWGLGRGRVRAGSSGHMTAAGGYPHAPAAVNRPDQQQPQKKAVRGFLKFLTLQETGAGGHATRLSTG